MEKTSAEKILKSKTEIYKDIEIEIVNCEIDENDVNVEETEKIKGFDLKKYLSEIVKDRKAYMSPEQIGKELSDRGVKDKQYYKRQRIVAALTAYLESL
jgi:hypothetical protein